MSVEEEPQQPAGSRLHDELVDSVDEELELEIDDERLARAARACHQTAARQETIDRSIYFKELLRLQRELVKLQDWVVHQKLKVVVLFEGRDAAGKGGVIKRMTQRLNPRICRVVALPAPTERERTQWYFQRYVAHLPGGRRNRAVRPQLVQPRRRRARDGLLHARPTVEEFFRTVPEFERMLVRSGIMLIKYWFSITDEEQHLRFLMRIHDPLKQWKLSPMDLESRRRWEDYTKAKEEMLERTHIPEAPWWVVEGVDKKKARLNCIHHLLQQIPYQEVDARADRAAGARAQAELPARTGAGGNARSGGVLGLRLSRMGEVTPQSQIVSSSGRHAISTCTLVSAAISTGIGAAA